MPTIRKRSWTSPAGERKSAWQVDYKDSFGARRAKQFSRKKEAEKWITQAAWEVSKGIHTADSESVTIAQAAKLWIARAESNDRERSTVERYRQLARLHINPLVGTERLSRLTQPRVEAFKDKLLETRSAATTAKAIRALSSILAEGQRRGLVAQNVAQNVRVVRSSRDRKAIDIPDKTELRALLDHADDDFRPLIMVAIFTGLRASEFRGLRWQDVNFARRSITVAQRADKFGNLGSPKSDAGRRSIPISSTLVAELREWKLRSPLSDADLVFPNTAGGVQDYGHMLRRRFHPLQIEAGLVDTTAEGRASPRYGFHALRHAAASAWVAQNIDLKRLQVWMGHASVQITLDTYGHLIHDDERDAELMAKAEAALLS